MLIVVLCTVALGHLALGQEPLVTTSQGTMKGKVLKSRDERDFFSFTKIPFAKPPLGPLRFMISEKADNWTGILDATQETPVCNQPLSPLGPGEEDCLYLNVFSPNLTGKLPVIFSIHGGAFMGGAAIMFSSAKFFMDEDVVFVAPNYRLGSLGFLSLEDNVIPGNMGLKDQALALEWVHKEISAFGGDPNRITVIGESAGAGSSGLICSAPRTNGLIKGCVLQSGSGWAPWAIAKPGISRQMAMELVNAVGCGDSGDILKCLQTKPVEMVANTSLIGDHFYIPLGFTMLSPVLEPANAPGALLTSWPTSANHNYPMIIGVCQDEGLLMTSGLENQIKDQAVIDKYINSFNKTLITAFDLQNRTDDFRRLRERYFTKDIEPLKAIRNYYSDYLFGQPALKSLSKHSGPTYYYRFNYTKGPHSMTLKSGGVPHGAEMPYFFEEFHMSTPDWPKPEDVALSKQLVKMWVNFARDQTPSSKDTVQWPQFQGQYYLDIQDSGVRISNFTQYQEILDFWKSYIPDESKPDSSKSSKIQSPLILNAIILISTIFNTIFD